MAHYNVYAGEAIFPRGRIFRPRGPIRKFTTEGTLDRALTEAARRDDPSRLAARLFVGLNVGTETKWTEHDVIDAVVRIRRAQGASPGATILSQRGIYEDRSKRIIDEPSLQIIIIDFDKTPKRKFTKEMIELGEDLTIELQQESILLEIQRRGLIEDQYTISPD